MEIEKELLAPCGLYCGVCGIRTAHRTQDPKLKDKLARAYGLSPEDISCEGCLSASPFKFCRVCAIRQCAGDRSFEGCYQCGDFPCSRVNEYPFPEARERILKAVPRWRELGTERWVEAEEKRYRCPQCQARLFRGAKKCRNCGELVKLD